MELAGCLQSDLSALLCVKYKGIKMKCISKDFAEHLYDLLEDAKQNSLMLLNDHDDSLGRTTESNRNTALMYEKEIEDLSMAIQKIKDVIDT